MNSYYYDSDALTSKITSLESQLETYSKDVKRITTLKDTMENSNEWKQENIKPAFISKYNEYILFFTIFSTKLEAHLNYLKAKNKAMQSLEEAYARRS